MRLWLEFRRRNIFRVAAVYGVTGWLLAQAAVVLEGTLSLPEWFDSFVVVTLMLGFPVAMLLAWAFELTPDGFKPTGATKTDAGSEAQAAQSKRRALNIVLGVGLIAALGFIAFDRVVLRDAGDTNVLPPVAETVGADVPAREASIAVLPFADMSSAGDQVYFGDGIAEELLNLLAKVDGLRVASRTSAFTFRERTASVDEIAEALNVAHILEGSVRKSGDQVRITAQLIETGTDEHLWSETYDRALTAENLFAIQDEISAAIVAEVGGRLDLGRTEARPTLNTRAYELFLSGRAKYATRSQANILEGLEELKQAVTLDPAFFEAHIALARAYKIARLYADRDPDDSDRLADDHLDIAARLDPDNPALPLARAWDGFSDMDVSWEDQAELFEAALAVNPDSTEALRGLSLTLWPLGRTDEAQTYLDRALALDPKSVILLINASGFAMRDGRFEEAEAHLRRALELDPDNPLARRGLIDVLYERGDIVTATRIALSVGDEPSIRATLSRTFVSLGMDTALQDHDPALAEKWLAIRAEDWPRVRRLMGPLEGIDEEMAIPVLVLSEHSPLVRDIMEANPHFIDFYVGPGDTPLSFIGQVEPAMAFETAYRSTDPDLADRMARKTDGFFETTSPEDMNSAYDLARLSRWHAMRGRPEMALSLLDTVAGRGQPMSVELRSENFDALRQMPRFQALVARFERIERGYREELTALMADPPDPWWSPDEE